jgi:hypothetical protein
MVISGLLTQRRFRRVLHQEPRRGTDQQQGRGPSIRWVDQPHLAGPQWITKTYAIAGASPPGAPLKQACSFGPGRMAFAR